METTMISIKTYRLINFQNKRKKQTFRRLKFKQTKIPTTSPYNKKARIPEMKMISFFIMNFPTFLIESFKTTSKKIIPIISLIAWKKHLGTFYPSAIRIIFRSAE